MPRKLGRKLTIKPSKKKVQKTFFELVTELTKRRSKKLASEFKKNNPSNNYSAFRPKIKDKDLAKQLGVTARSFRRYKLYQAEPSNKNSRKPSAKILEKLKKVAKKKKVRLTRSSSGTFTAKTFNQITEVLPASNFNELKSWKQSDKFFGALIRINILLKTSGGDFNEWITLILNNIEFPELLTNKNELDQFILGRIGSIIRSKNSLYVTQNIQSFSILEIDFQETTNEYEENKPTSKKSIKKSKSKKTKVQLKNFKQAGKGKKHRKGKK